MLLLAIGLCWLSISLLALRWSKSDAEMRACVFYVCSKHEEMSQRLTHSTFNTLQNERNGEGGGGVSASANTHKHRQEILPRQWLGEAYLNHYSTGIIPLRHSLMYALLKNGHEVIREEFLPLNVIRSLERERQR